MLDFRQGRYKQAVEQLTEAVKAHGKGGTVEDRLFLAMAYAHLGQSAEARQWLARAVQGIAQTKDRDQCSRAFWVPYELQLLRRQTEAALKQLEGK
jgi:lipopolysaccharide biosynthesis regulator YciM